MMPYSVIKCLISGDRTPDGLYQECRKKFGSKQHMWETLRAYIKIFLFHSWDNLLKFAFACDDSRFQYAGLSP